MISKSTLWIFFGKFAVLRRIYCSTCIFLFVLCQSFVLLFNTRDSKNEALLFITQSGKQPCNGLSVLRTLGKKSNVNLHGPKV